MTLNGRKATRRTAVVAVAALSAGVAVLGQVYLTGPDADAAQRPDRPAAGPAAPEAVPVAARRPGPRTVTLITGDRVTVTGPAGTSPAIEPAKGREKISFAVSVVGGHLMVFPADAARLVQTSKVDARLFDVTELIASGQADRRKSTVPLIVRYKSEGPAKKAIERGGAKITRALPAVRGAAVSAPASRTQSLWKALTTDSGVQKIWLDGVRRRSLDTSVPQIGAPAAWAAGLTGKGMTVAVLDGAVDTTHPDLAGRVTVRSFVEGEEVPAGGDLHGTHVASTIAGNGAASGGKYRGVAPEATVLSGMVCGEIDCPDSAILAGMQWAAVEQKARVINMSLGGTDLAGTDPLEEAVGRLTEQTGALFVIAAGNSGEDGAETVESPGSADAALTVGAVDKQDRIADFSGRGPRIGDAAVKPDITAPGVDIVAAKATGAADVEVPPGTPDGYIGLDGTSMATPHVSGAALLLAQAHADWRAARLKDTLMGTAQPNAGLGSFEQGAGRVDLARAVHQTVTADPPSVSYGRLPWPHTEDAAIARKVTYRNDGPQPVSLALTVAGAAVFTLSTPTLDVPAGGTAAVTVTATLPKTAGDVPYTARLTATAGDQRVVTPLAVDKEPERYTVTVHNVGADGKPASKYLLQIYDPKDPRRADLPLLPWDASGTVTMRLPKGRFTMGSYIDTSAAGDGTRQSVLYQPLVVVDRAVEVTFDARRAKPVTQRVPGKSAVTRTAFAGVAMKVDGAPASFGVVQDTFDGLSVGQVGGDEGVTELTGIVGGGWTAAGETEDSPYLYAVADRMPGAELLAGYRRRYTAKEFATETQDVRAPAGGTARQWIIPVGEDGEVFGGITRVGLPAGKPKRVNHYGVEDGVRWATELGLDTTGDGFYDSPRLFQAPLAYRAGERTRQVWGQAPFGPGLSDAKKWVVRDGDLLSVALPQLGDAGGHPGLFWGLPTRTKLFRDGELIADDESFHTGALGLPDAEAGYRVEQTTEGGVAGLSTRTATTLTFRSARPAGDAPEIPPVITVHFGVPTARKVPVDVRDATGRPVAVRELAVDVSTDDGKTWKPAKVTGGAAAVQVPEGTAFVSLRARATADGGSTAEQTMIRAYRPK